MRRFVGFVAVSLVGLVSVLATQWRVLSIEKLAEAADAIVLGTVTSKTCQRDSQGRIFTRVELSAKEHWKGPKSSFAIVHAGGVLGDVAVTADGLEQYDVGEEVVAFVRFNARGEGVTVGMSQGKFNVWKRDGRTFVRNRFHGASDNSPTPGSKSLGIEEFKARVTGGSK